MKKEKKIKAIIFDVGSVLQLEKKPSPRIRGHNKGVHEYIANKLGIDLDSWFDAIDTPYGKSFTGEISEKEALTEITNNVGISKKKLIKLYNESIKKHFIKNKELYKIAFTLKKKSFLIGILSDQWYLSKKVLIPKKDAKNFDVVVISCEVGVRKPNIRIYRLLMKKLRKKKKGIKASEVLFIDNRTYNLKPAQKIGMKTLLFKNNKQLLKQLKTYNLPLNIPKL